MKKSINNICKLILCFIFMIAIGIIATIDVNAEELDFYELVEGIKMEGPNCVFLSEKTAEFSLDKVGYQPEASQDIIDEVEDEPYMQLHYQWSSSDDNVAKFDYTEAYYEKGCFLFDYPVLHRLNIFKVSPGKTTIYCTISDDNGNEIVLSKELTVLENTPINEIKLGNYYVDEIFLNGITGRIYSNNLSIEDKLLIDLDTNWEVVDEYSYNYGNNSGFSKWVTIVNNETGEEFIYKLFVYKYTERSLNMTKLGEGCELSSVQMPYYYYVSYSSKEDLENRNTFNSGEELVYKFIKYFGYDKSSVKFEDGIFTYYVTNMRINEWEYVNPYLEEESKTDNNLKETESLDEQTTISKTSKPLKIKIKNCKIIKTTESYMKGKVVSNKKKVKLKLLISKCWGVEKILVKQGKKTTNITKKQFFKTKANKKYKVYITLKSIDTGEIYKYRCILKRKKKK